MKKIISAMFAVQISYVTNNGGRTTTTELINAQDEKDARAKAQKLLQRNIIKGES
ncbi:hypothetical protein [Thiocystis violacea]|uniref:hypothetical protein n=1 Tax=Thiocystis violacea TaxID=13725 RepID=UPI001906FDC6|nr:hypothetical protein [Thiocystis violacea]